MLKQGISLAMLCCASHVFAADIFVTTSEDVVRSDDQCSLREAIEYINQGRPEAGYNGCGGKDSSNTIYLKNTTYQVTKEILISKDVNIRTQYESGPMNKVLGRHNAVLQMTGTDRIFNIDRKSETTETEADDNTLIDVNLYEMTLKGCSAAVCKEQGGLILNKENLSLDYTQLLEGKAKLGGAIYNVGKFDPTKSLASVEIRNSILSNNRAEKGAVVYSEIPQFLVSSSIVRDNEVTDHRSALFETQEGFTQETATSFSSTIVRGLQNSTIFKNTGPIIRVRDAMGALNLTMIFNNHGLIVDAPHDLGFVANSILAKNGTQDCQILTGGSADKISNNLYSVGCAGTQSQELGSTNLIASSNLEGQCDINSDGILCPFREYEDISLGYFKPRLLETYMSLNDSPIVQKGPHYSAKIKSCLNTDQRGFGRVSTTNLCDRGAIELRIDLSTIGNTGQDILYKDVAKMSIADRLVDGELITPAQCEKLFGKASNGQPWQPGCMKIVQTNTPSKGQLVITQDGEITYQPNGDWHGSDEFNLQVVTTTTRFSDSVNPYITIPTRIVQSPPNNYEDYKVKTSGGALGLGVLVGLLGLIVLRRSKQ